MKAGWLARKLGRPAAAAAAAAILTSLLLKRARKWSLLGAEWMLLKWAKAAATTEADGVDATETGGWWCWWCRSDCEWFAWWVEALEVVVVAAAVVTTVEVDPVVDELLLVAVVDGAGAATTVAG